MALNSKCPIWGTPAMLYNPDGRDGFTVDSPRAGGKYFVPFAILPLEEVEEMITSLWDNGQTKARLTSILVKQRRLGTECPEISIATIEEAEKRSNLPIYERADRLLECLKRKSKCIGEEIQHSKLNVYELLCWSESINRAEVLFLIDYLIERGWILVSSQAIGQFPNQKVTVEGYAHLAEIDNRTIDSTRAFVAMWFDDSMLEAWEQGIRPAIVAAGYKPIRVDQQQHIDKIDDRIIAEIKRSRFIVADFTQGKGGARGGVYYEAGYAHGLNIPVILCCHKDALDKVHFDLRQYNHIVWDTPQNLKQQLADRIAAVIGLTAASQYPILNVIEGT